MANEFIIKHGFHSDGNSQITGSLDISDSLTVNGGAVGAAFPFSGDAQITGSLIVVSSATATTPTTQSLKIDSSGNFYHLGYYDGGSTGFANNSTNTIIGNDIADDGDFYNTIIGYQAGVANPGHANVIIGVQTVTNGNVDHSVAIGATAQTNNDGDISIGSDAGDTANSKGINIGRYAHGEGVKGIVLNTAGVAVSPTKANTFGLYMTNASPNFEIEATGSSTLSGSSFTIEKSGSKVFEVIGSEGDLFTITDNLTTGSLFAVKDISGIPLLDVTANSTIPDVVTVGQSNLLLDSGSLEVVGSISASGDVTGRLQRPTQEFGTNFTASAEYSGYYLRTGGNVTCSIQANALPSINSEFDFFQTSSVGNMLFETGSTSVILNSKNNNLNLAGQFSSATLKYVGNNTFDLMGDLT